MSVGKNETDFPLNFYIVYFGGTGQEFFNIVFIMMIDGSLYLLHNFVLLTSENIDVHI